MLTKSLQYRSAQQSCPHVTASRRHLDGTQTAKKVGVLTSQLYRYSRLIRDRSDFITAVAKLLAILIDKGYDQAELYRTLDRQLAKRQYVHFRGTDPNKLRGHIRALTSAYVQHGTYRGRVV